MSRPARPRTWPVRATGAVLLALLVASSLPLLAGPTHPVGTRAGSPGTGPIGGTVQVAPAFSPAPGTTDLGPLPPGHALELAVGLAPPDPAGLARMAALAVSGSGPAGAAVGRLPPNLAPTPAQAVQAQAYFSGYGLAVTVSPDRLMLLVDGPSSAVATAFHTSFREYRGPDGRAFFSHPVAATLPGGLPWSGVLGLGNQSAIRPAATRLGELQGLAGPLAACPKAVPFAPCSIHLAYNESGLLSAGSNGTGYRLGVVDVWDGAERQAQLASDLSSFASSYGVPAGTVHYSYPIPLPSNANSTSTGWSVEEALDLEWSRAMAPGAAIWMTFAPNTTPGLYGAVDWLVANHLVDVLTMSWGEPDVGVFNAFSGACSVQCNASSDGSYTLLNPVLEEAALEGISVFAASGDCGAADGTSGVATNYPASDPFVTGVGGTDLTVNQTSGAYKSETAWSGNASGSSSPGCVNQGGSGGGYAPFPAPWWQSDRGFASTHRGVPDVAAIGGSSVDVVYQGYVVAVSGTSLASPVWAGIAASIDSSQGRAVGFLNPSLYALARAPGNSSLLHDVTSGSNGYGAHVGWDPVTGVGSPDVGALASALGQTSLGRTSLGASVSVSPRFVAVGKAVSASVTATGGSGVYALADVGWGDGNSSLGWAVNHSFPSAGVYIVQATVVDSAGNFSTSAAVAVVVGGGGALSVSLAANRTTVAVGAPVTFSATASGGTGPYRYTYLFGDGSYVANVSSGSVSHPFGVAGGYCALAVVADAAHPPNGGSSNRLAVSVGGLPGPNCTLGLPLSANFTASTTVADLPGDIPFNVTVQGGLPPYSVRYTTDDPYVDACNCGIFRTAGVHNVTAWINDSGDQQLRRNLSVTIYPSIVATFNASTLIGPAPLTVNFSATASSGFGANASQTNWSFGDGTFATGAAVAHLFASPGLYTAIARVDDRAGGHASEAFVLDATGAAGGLAVGATIRPAVDVPSGDPVEFSAVAQGAAGPLGFLWSFGANDSAFGATAEQTFGPYGCVAAGSCPLTVRLNVSSPGGGTLAVLVPLSPAVAGRSSALVLNDSLPTALGGSAPFTVNASASARGLPGGQVSWSFGDGSGASGPWGNHTYAAGNYTLALVATDPLGDRLVRTHAVVVSPPPPAPMTVAITGSVVGGLAPLNVSYSAAASSGRGPYLYAWQFGDGASAAGANASHLFPVPGNYTVTVTATDATSRSASASVFTVAYATTEVTVGLGGVPTEVRDFAPFSANISVTPLCVALSLPACGAAPLGVGLWLIPAVSGPPSLLGSVTVSPGTPSTVPVSVGLPPGEYRLQAQLSAPGYAGSANVSLTVLPVSPTGPSGGMTLPSSAALAAAALLGAVGGAGALGVVLYLRGRRRPPAASSPPTG